MRALRLSLSLVLIVLSSMLSACGARMVELQPLRAVALPTAQQPDTLRAAIVRALQSGGYALESEESGRIVARQVGRGTSLRVALMYSPTQLQIAYLDSEGLRAAPHAQTGRMMISARYERLMSALSQDIDAEIGRPEREAREAEERRVQAIADAAEAEREQQLALVQEQRMREQQQLDAQAAEQERERQAVLDAERIRADAQRPVVVQAAPVYAQPPVYAQQPAYAQQAAYAQPAPSEATYGTSRLRPGFMPDPQRFAGRAFGRIPAEQLGGGCQGWIAAQPDFVFYLDGAFPFVRIDTAARGDTTLVVRGPGGVFCDDDSAGGQNARITGAQWGGRYEVFVGTFQRGAVADYQLEISEIAPAGAVAAAPPQPAPPDCRERLLAAGHHAAHLTHCEGAEPYCAEALLAAGHHPAHLVHCRGVQARCAVALIRSGNHPATLGNCR